MAKIVIEIETNNDAFVESMQLEVSLILGRIVERLDQLTQDDFILLRDSNGNTVGSANIVRTAQEQQDAM